MNGVHLLTSVAVKKNLRVSSAKFQSENFCVYTNASMNTFIVDAVCCWLLVLI